VTSRFIRLMRFPPKGHAVGFGFLLSWDERLKGISVFLPFVAIDLGWLGGPK